MTNGFNQAGTQEGNIEGVHEGRLGDGSVDLIGDFTAALGVAFHRSQQIPGSGTLVLKFEIDLGKMKDVRAPEGSTPVLPFILLGLDMVNSESVRCPTLADESCGGRHLHGHHCGRFEGIRHRSAPSSTHISFLERCHRKAVGTFTGQIVHFCVRVLVSCFR